MIIAAGIFSSRASAAPLASLQRASAVKKQREIDQQSHMNRDKLERLQKNEPKSSNAARMGSPLDAMLEQKKNLIERKNELLKTTAQEGKDVKTIEEQLKIFDEQIQYIDTKISESLAKKQQKTLGLEDEEEQKTEEKQTSSDPVKAAETRQIKQFSGVVATDAAVASIEQLAFVQHGLEGQAAVLKSEIDLDKSRCPSGAVPNAKYAGLSDLQERIERTTNIVNEQMGDVNRQIKESASAEEASAGETHDSASEEANEPKTDPYRKASVSVYVEISKLGEEVSDEERLNESA